MIADKYNEQMFGFPDVLTMTHNQKMKIGQYLASGYVTSAEVLNMIERIPKDSTSPLAYLLKSLENLKQERLYEQKSIAHLNAENYYSMKKEVMKMFSVVFVVISFIAIIGITLVIVEAHNAPLLADDEMTTISYPNHNTHNTHNVA